MSRIMFGIERSSPNLFNVSPLVEFERLHDSEGGLVIRVLAPMGPSLYMFKGAVYDRVTDADVRVKSDVQITSMMARKQGCYSERTVYSWVTKDDLEMDLLDAVRDALRANDADHPWLSLSDGELLRAVRFYGRDQLTGERGFNLAAVALLGTWGGGTRSLYKFSRLYTGEDPVLEDGDQFTALVPAPPVMVSVAEYENGHDAATGAERNGAVIGSKRNCTRAEIERVVDGLIARHGSFPASAVSERVASVGERTVRRHLADMVKEGKLISDLRGRSTTYHAGSSAEAPSQ